MPSLAIRDVVCSAVSEFTSVSPELEKPGLLLPPRPPDPGGPDLGLCLPPGSPPPAAAGRRPADVRVPTSMSGFAEAWDFSVSSLLRVHRYTGVRMLVSLHFCKHHTVTRAPCTRNTFSRVAQECFVTQSVSPFKKQLFVILAHHVPFALVVV